MGFLEDMNRALETLGDVADFARRALRHGGIGDDVAPETFGLSRGEYQNAIEAGVPSCGIADIPGYSGHPFEVVDDNAPAFSEGDIALPLGYESYSDLDDLGRCGAAFALVSIETMPRETESRKTIKHVIPSGWQNTEYGFIEGKKLYNRCHLIGYGLTAEQDNERNLFTGTRYLNHAMRVFENMVADHCRAHAGAHVLFRATPVFHEGELVARGVQLEALSICEDDAPLKFNVYLHNVQPGVKIDYAAGESRKDDSVRDSMLRDCVVNDATKTFHVDACSALEPVDPSRLRRYTGLRKKLEEAGYKPCGRCKP